MIKRVHIEGATNGRRARGKTNDTGSARRPGKERTPVSTSGAVRSGKYKSKSDNPDTSKMLGGKKAAMLLSDMMHEAASLDDDPIPVRNLTRIHKGKIMVPPVVDGRTYRAKRFKEIFKTIVSDLGGFDRVTELKRAMARRCAALAVIAEEYETYWLIQDGLLNPMALDSLMSCGRTLANLADKLGLERVARDVTPDGRNMPATLEEYVERKGR